ncbi:MAG: Lrp/AsnC family transcriptional regulator [Kitasatospora sp.]|jgi:DNA-binding Lrp family transcriptional regulator|nr:Lrp/AsnC family transcriptional regulator [Kitasatospora sp.]
MRTDEQVPELDRLDRQLVQALMADGRVPFSRLAEVLGVTDQTVTRRYRRLRTEGLLRVIALPAPDRVGYHQSQLRIQCVPGAAGAIADALARRPDIAWVSINEGGAEVACMTRSRSRQERDSLLFHKLPGTRQVTGVSARTFLHMFRGGPGGWHHGELDPEQWAALRRPTGPGRGTHPLDDPERAMLAVLERDGRAGYPELAAATGKSESTVRRRLEHLTDHGIVYFDAEVLPATLGYQAEAHISAQVAPSDLDAVGRAVGSHPEVPYAVATTGRSNLYAVVLCRDIADLYEYITVKLGALAPITNLEVTSVLRNVKRAGMLTDGTRLYDPPPA